MAGGYGDGPAWKGGTALIILGALLVVAGGTEGRPTADGMVFRERMGNPEEWGPSWSLGDRDFVSRAHIGDTDARPAISRADSARASSGAFTAAAANVTYIEPLPGYYCANCTVFVDSRSGWSNSSCGALTSPCATLSQALALSDVVVLLPGTHYVEGTVAVKDRGQLSISGVMESDGVRPEIKAHNNSAPGSLILVGSCAVVTLDSIEISDWTCRTEAACQAAAVAVQAAESIAVRNCVFLRNRKNTSILSFGVALSLTTPVTGSVVIDGCTFVANEATTLNPRALISLGAGVAMYCGSAVVSNSIFSENRLLVLGTEYHTNAEQRLGGGDIYASFRGSFTISGSLFNSSSVYCTLQTCTCMGSTYLLGGAIVEVHDSAWVGNIIEVPSYRPANGGGLTVTCAEATITNSTFADNVILSRVGVSSTQMGAGLYTSCVFPTITGCSFLRNIIYTAACKPVGTTGYGAGCLITCGGFATVTDSVFDGNAVRPPLFGQSPSMGSEAFGGGLYILGDCLISSSVFRDNSALGGAGSSLAGIAGGGAVLLMHKPTDNPRAAVEDCLFVNNTAESGYGHGSGEYTLGGAVSVYEPITFTNTVFIRNKAVGAAVQRSGGAGGPAGGGALYNWESASITNCSFVGNSARGGSTREPKNSDDHCGGSAIGGAIFSGFIQLEGSLFEGNVASAGDGVWASSCGGAIGVGEGSAFTAHSCNFTANRADGAFDSSAQSARGDSFGGALCLDASEAPSYPIVVTNSSFQRNSVTGSRCLGGAASVRATATFEGCLVEGNSVTGNLFGLGGGLYANGLLLANTVVRDNSLFSDQGNGFGGALYITQGLYGFNFTLESNFASYGGALAAQFCDRGLVDAFQNFTFINNTATRGGGAVYYNVEIFRSVDGACDIIGSGNKSPCGNLCATSPQGLVVFQRTNGSLWPGEAFAVSVGIADGFDRVCYHNGYETQLQALPVNGTNFETGIPQDLVAASEDGVFTFSSVQLFEPAGTEAVIGFATVSASIGTFTATTFSVEAEYELESCSPGHFPVSSTACSECYSASYNFDGEVCVSCPVEGYQCMTVGERDRSEAFSILPDYYPDSFVDPTVLESCPIPGSCPGYNCSISAVPESTTWQVSCGDCETAREGLDCTCAEGYTGRLCSACVINDDVCYFPSNGECADSASLPIGLWGPVMELFLYVIITVVWFSLRQDAEKGSSKILVLYVQTVAVFCSSVFVPFGIIPLLASVTSGVVLNWLNVASLRCLSPSLFSTKVVSLCLLTLMPTLVFLPLVVLIHALKLAATHLRDRYRRRRAFGESDLDQLPLLSHIASVSPPGSPTRSSSSSSLSSSQSESSESEGNLPWKQDLWEKSVHSALYIAYASFFNICNLLFASWGCQKDATGNWYSVTMPWLQCGQGEWFQLLVVSCCLAVFTVVLPVVVFACLLYRDRERLDDRPVRRQLGFLYESYRRDVFWWELVALVRRLALSLTLSLFSKSGPVFYSMAVATQCVAAALHMHFMPYHTKLENMGELLSILLFLFTFQCSQFVTAVRDISGFSLWSLEASVLLLNGAFMMVLLWFVLQDIRAEYQHVAGKYYGTIRSYGRKLRSFASSMKPGSLSGSL